MGVPRTEGTGRVVDTTATATAALVRATGVAAAICSGIGVEKGSPVQLTKRPNRDAADRDAGQKFVYLNLCLLGRYS